MEKEVTLTDKNFTEEVINSQTPVLVDFWAEWCGPCKMIGPVVAEIAREFEGKIKVGKVNVDDNQATAAKFGIRGIPTLLFFKGGELVNQVVGVQPKSKLLELINKII
ncbi:MAG: thioredoxin [Thermodesulfobacteriota bacterium]|jgi:thioredoxin 1|nr:MAG: thioredoxin [Thermodesulfobacteriota bacterium]